MATQILKRYKTKADVYYFLNDIDVRLIEIVTYLCFL